MAALGFIPILLIALIFGIYLNLALSGVSNTASPSLNNYSVTTTVICTGPEQSVYVTVVSDATHTPIEGANVSGDFTLNVNGQNTTVPIQSQLTPSNGTVLLQLPSEVASCSIGTYTVYIVVNSPVYDVQLSPPTLHLAQTVIATIGIPSAKIIDMHITNTGQCIQNGTTITNGTGFFC